jgi:hypothetical protein
LDRKKPIRRAQSADSLMRPLVIVVLDPKPHPLAGRIKTVKLSTAKKILPDRFPKSLDLAQRHRMVGGALYVMDPIFF